ncbi:MAG: AraC family transcriptional regulator [Bacteroidaceae bacterium]|nr:AraC family transcriptional regulator [Bacteroidaceae bacterium]
MTTSLFRKIPPFTLLPLLLLIAAGLFLSIPSEAAGPQPIPSTHLLKVGRPLPSAPEESSAASWKWPVILALLLAAATLLLLFMRRKKQTEPIGNSAETTDQVNPNNTCNPDNPNNSYYPVGTDNPYKEPQESSTKKPNNEEKLLIAAIHKVMEEEQLYLSERVKLSDLADRVQSNSRIVSDCIRNMCGCTFSQLLSTYRINHAKRLMLKDHDEKISNIATLSGFANDTSFFRTFKAITGQTPREWLAEQKED